MQFMLSFVFSLIYKAHSRTKKKRTKSYRFLWTGNAFVFFFFLFLYKYQISDKNELVKSRNVVNAGVYKHTQNTMLVALIRFFYNKITFNRK